MILQALKEYYDRKAAEPNSGIASYGWERKEIPFIIVLDREGNLMQIEDTREGEGKNKRARTFIVPHSIKKTSGVCSNLLWEVAGYVFGIDAKKNVERAREQKKAFIDRLERDLSGVDEVKPVLNFLNNITTELLESEANWKEIVEKNSILSFRIEGQQRLVCDCEAVREALTKDSGARIGYCLVTGKKCGIDRLHSSIKGVYGAQSSGANIVSFNEKAFCSFNKVQGDNAPVGEAAVFSYTTALNTLLGKDSKQHIRIGDATTVFWSEKISDFESDFSCFFSEPPKDDPDAGTRKIRALFESVNSGAYCKDEGDTRFYVLGLAPNAARIAVRFWEVDTIQQFAKKIQQHFEDLTIVKSSKEPEFYSLWRLLVNIAKQGESKNIPPNLAGDFMRSVLTGAPYPETLLQAALRRTRAGIKIKTKSVAKVERVIPEIAALIKAYLNRYYRTYLNKNYKEITMGLDSNQPSVGYQLGRLFATLEKIQEEANPDINRTIRAPFYGAACTRPVTVFSTLLRLKNHHLAKMDNNKGRVINLEKLLAEIMGNINDFPGQLDLHEQGRFAIGYYHQRQDFFTKKTTN